MKKMLLTTVGLSLLVFSVPAWADDSYTATCESLGYKTDLSACTVGLPLLCPVSGNTEGNKLKCLCMTESCRGYSLAEDDLDALASDGRKVREHIKTLETCDSGVGADKVTYYRIKECKDGSLYQIQNNKPTCDVGCPSELYPYSEHPGDLAGQVESCTDEKGVWFGYISCNDGWVASGVAGHECQFNDCSIKNYPYTRNPNEVQQRGTIQYCKVGGNNYYQYTACDSGYILKGSVCQAKCQLQNCTVSSSSKGYNEWSCAVANKLSCQAGDAAYINNAYLGIIGYQPDGNGETLIIATEKNNGVTPFAEIQFSNIHGAGYYYDSIYSGKAQTQKLLNYKAAHSEVEFQAANACYQYTSLLCNGGFCAAGEWYLPSFGELTNTFSNRYILYNATGQTNPFIGGYAMTSNKSSGAWSTLYSYHSGTNVAADPQNAYRVFPVISYTQR